MNYRILQSYKILTSSKTLIFNYQAFNKYMLTIFKYMYSMHFDKKLGSVWTNFSEKEAGYSDM